MRIIRHNPPGIYKPYENYSHAAEIAGGPRFLFISGLNGVVAENADVPTSFEEQGNVVWDYIGQLLKSADMGYENIVSLRTYLSDRKYDASNVALRKKYLKDNGPASTVVVCDLLNGTWKLEVEVIAAG